MVNLQVIDRASSSACQCMDKARLVGQKESSSFSAHPSDVSPQTSLSCIPACAFVRLGILDAPFRFVAYR